METIADINKRIKELEDQQHLAIGNIQREINQLQKKRKDLQRGNWPEKFKLPALIRDNGLEAGPMLCIVPVVGRRGREWTVEDLADYGRNEEKIILWADGIINTNSLCDVDNIVDRFTFIRELSADDLSQALAGLAG